MDIIVDRVSSSSTIGGVKKEEEESVVTKEEEEEKGEEVDDYADWTKGNWCFLLPATTTNNGTITTTAIHSAAVQLEKGRRKNNDKAATIPLLVVSGSIMKRAAPERRRDSLHGRQKRNKDVSFEKDLLSDNNNDEDEDDDDDELPKKKKRKLKCCRSQQQYNSSSINSNNLPSSNNNKSIKDNKTKVDDNKNEIKNAHVDTIIKQEEGVETKEEEEEEEEDNSDSRINAADNNDNDNETDADADDDGYESWTVGNWCLLLPSTTTTTTSLTNDEQKDDEPPSEEVSLMENTTSTQRSLRSSSSRRRRSRRESSSVSSSSVGGDDTDDDKYDEKDYVDDDDDDDDDDTIDKKTNKTGKSTIKHKNSAYNKQWHRMFPRLVAYQKKHGSANVPRNYQDDPKLATWVHRQRISYSGTGLSEERIRLLLSIGLVLKHHEITPWDEMFRKLVAYKKEHKSTLIPQRYKADPHLGMWVHNQRTFYKTKTLSIDRINRLESIGYVWDPLDAQWMRMYSKLVAYKKEHKSTNVRRGYARDPPLGRWVDNQRRESYKRGKARLSEKRLKLLNSINFAWSVRKVC